MSSFRREVGIAAVSWSALLAFRIRVSMSAIGSVSIGVPLLPGALGHAGDHALVGELPQADPAEPELPEDRARAAAPVTARIFPRLEQQRAGAVVVCRRRRDCDVETAYSRDLVVVDLGKDDLLADAERVVPAAVERARVEPTEVADARQRDRDESIEEL